MHGVLRFCFSNFIDRLRFKRWDVREVILTNKAEKDSFIGFLSSTKLTIFIFIFLALASIAGTIIIQQGTSEAVHIDSIYSLTTIRIFNRLGFFDLYHSAIYVGLLMLLAVNLVACTFKRIQRDISRSKTSNPESAVDAIVKSPQNRIFFCAGKVNNMAQIMTASLRGSGYRLKQIKESRWIATRGNGGRWGFYTAHLGIFIILSGGMISSLLGIEGMLWLAPGQESHAFNTSDDQVIPMGFTLRCVDFMIDYYDSGMVKEFRSELTAIPENGAPLSHTLLVNHPLSYNSYRFFQSNYQESGAQKVILTLTQDDGESSDVELDLSGTRELTLKNGKHLRLQSLQFESDFFLDQGGKPSSKSPGLNNPALLIQVQLDEETPVKFWIFKKFPEFHGAKQDLGFKLIFKELTPSFITGIQVTKDPGSTLIWIGSVILVLGLILSFFVTPQGLYLASQFSSQGTEIFIKGVTFGGQKWNSPPQLEPISKRIKANLNLADAGNGEPKNG
jgi:cytochrome c biogenesis protein